MNRQAHLSRTLRVILSEVEESEMLVQEAIPEIMMNRISIVAAHRLSASRRCDMILAIDEGGIAAKGSHAELIGSDNL